jgi:hypothetical protein
MRQIRSTASAHVNRKHRADEHSPPHFELSFAPTSPLPSRDVCGGSKGRNFGVTSADYIAVMTGCAKAGGERRRMATLRKSVAKVLWRAPQTAGTAPPHLLRKSGARKSVVAVTGAAARPTHTFEQGPAAAIAHNPGRFAPYSGYVSTPPGAVRLNRMKASTFPGSDVASLRRPPI